MKKWEYTYALIVPSEDPCDEINKLGRDGWEAFAHWPEDKDNHGGFYLRREVTNRTTREAPRCTHEREIPWPGHGNAVLKRVRCGNRTWHESKRCRLHRSNGVDEGRAGTQPSTQSDQ